MPSPATPQPPLGAGQSIPPELLAAILKSGGQMMGASPADVAGGTPTLGSNGQTGMEALGQMAQAAGGAHKKANPSLYGADGGFDWAKALKDHQGWGATVTPGQ